jgi:glycosyltransferase involved in cell wall biosynthesis
VRIRIVTDTWEPEINGVVRTLQTTARTLSAMGHDIRVVHAGMFGNIRFPLYQDIRLAFVPPSRLSPHLADADHVHIATEGPLGVSAALWLRRHRWAHSTSYHTDFPSYMWKYLRMPPSASYRLLRTFHGWSRSVMVAAPSLRNQLEARGFRHVKRWSRGVDGKVFQPLPERPTRSRPLAVYVGRVAREKNVEAFLRIDRPVDKMVVGDGPLLDRLRNAHPDVQFAGALHGAALAKAYAEADVMIFPSLTDTFGLVMLEALACGTPVAAYPADAPRDLLADQLDIACLDEDLGRAIDHCLTRTDRVACRRFAKEHTWERCTEQFYSNLVPIR